MAIHFFLHYWRHRSLTRGSEMNIWHTWKNPTCNGSRENEAFPAVINAMCDGFFVDLIMPLAIAIPLLWAVQSHFFDFLISCNSFLHKPERTRQQVQRRRSLFKNFFPWNGLLFRLAMLQTDEEPPNQKEKVGFPRGKKNVARSLRDLPHHREPIILTFGPRIITSNYLQIRGFFLALQLVSTIPEIRYLLSILLAETKKRRRRSRLVFQLVQDVLISLMGNVIWLRNLICIFTSNGRKVQPTRNQDEATLFVKPLWDLWLVIVVICWQNHSQTVSCRVIASALTDKSKASAREDFKFNLARLINGGGLCMIHVTWCVKSY